ncbi:hypothetical protein RvY_06807 [Ramazzottius varieornatus]|uniref:Uncharacterized protein n=1 Tax=Ramazzottius varieornatus TaxID=947166 RepID=A0A1D1V554_RAMVA|nr:hypothetical protein RvY_06807 [Ramazzottius varieornatus]
MSEAPIDRCIFNGYVDKEEVERLILIHSRWNELDMNIKPSVNVVA